MTIGAWRIGLMMMILGGLGSVLLVILNMLAYFYWARPDAVPGSPLWRYVWLPSYISWVTLGFLGTSLLIKCRRFRETFKNRTFDQ